MSKRLVQECIKQKMGEYTTVGQHGPHNGGPGEAESRSNAQQGVGSAVSGGASTEEQVGRTACIHLGAGAIWFNHFPGQRTNEWERAGIAAPRCRRATCSRHKSERDRTEGMCQANGNEWPRGLQNETSAMMRSQE